MNITFILQIVYSHQSNYLIMLMFLDILIYRLVK